MIDTIAQPGQRETYRQDAESKFIGCLLLEPDRIGEVSDVVSARDFADAPLGKLFALIVAMHESGKKVNEGTVMLAAKRTGLIDQMGGAAEYVKIINSIANGHDYLNFAKEVARLSACRQVESAIELCAAEIAKRDCEPRRAIEALMARIQDLGVTADSKQVHIHEVLSKIYDDGFKPDDEFSKNRIGTGFPRLDALIGGLYAKSLVILGGYFGSGKSTLASDIGARAASTGKSVLLFSIEMTAEEFGQRILSIEAGVSMAAWQRQRSDEEQSSIKAIADLSKKWKFSIDETSRQSLSSIRAAARLKKASRDGLDVLIVDNLTLVSHSISETKERYKAITIELKKLSRELDCCVLLVAQLNATAVDSEPNSKSWADCKSIEGDADVAMMLHKHARPDTWQHGDLDEYSLIVTKNRSRGDKGKIPLTWNGEFQRFSDGTWNG